MLAKKDKNEKIIPITKYFKAGFDESVNVISQVGNLIAIGDTRKSDVITSKDTKIVTFVFERFFIRTTSSASLTVNIVFSNGISVISVIGAGGGQGFLNIDMGENDALSKIFWNRLNEQFADFCAKEITPRIGVLGGTFDPIHLGHKALAEAAIEELSLRKLIIMPAGIQPFKQDRNITEDFHRKAMVNMTFDDNYITEVSDYEMSNNDISYTIKTLAYLGEQYPNDEIFFISGTDSFIEMETWHKGKDILKSYSLAVSIRPGYREEELNDKIKSYTENYGTNIIKIKSKMPTISSTIVRNRIASGQDISDIVPKVVERYIKENGLYK